MTKWLLILMVALSSTVAWAQYVPLSPVVSPYLGVDMNSNSQWPDGISNTLVRFNCVRIWDTPSASGWAQVETTAGNYVYTTLDTVLNKAIANNVTCVMMPLNRTPTFYSSNQADTSCGYYLSIGSGTVNTAVGGAVTKVTGTTFLNTWTHMIVNGVYYSFTFISGTSGTLSPDPGNQTGVAFDTPSTNAGSGPGQCDMPTDINTDGSGTNISYKNWVAALATHIKTTFPTLSMIYEFYNEPDTCKFFQSDAATQGSCTGTGTIAELQRWEWDVYCIIKGTANNNPFVGGQSCATAQGLVTSVTLSGAVDTTAKVLMGSYHGAPFSYNLAQNFLYCNHPTVPTNCPGATGALYTDAINFHFKYLGKPAVYGDATTTLEAVADNWIGGVGNILQPAEFLKPLYNTEGGAAAGGWIDCTSGTVNTSGTSVTRVTGTNFASTWTSMLVNGVNYTFTFINANSGTLGTSAGTQTGVAFSLSGGTNPPFCNYADPDMEASAVARNNIYQVWKGVSNAVWYDCTYSGGFHCLGGTADTNHLADKAYDTSGQWLLNSKAMICTTSAPGTAHSGLFTFTCTATTGGGSPVAFIWDNSQECAAGACTTTNQTVGVAFTSYTDLTGATTAIVNHTVPVGIKPLQLNATPTTGIGGVKITGLKVTL